MERIRSPFPGMDPYLERPSRWRDVHASLITYLRDDLQTLLPKRYFAAMEDRVYIDDEERLIGPDVRVVDMESGGGIATAVAEADPAVVVSVQSVEVEEHFIEIRDIESGNRVVTVIEILSPTNKRAGAAGMGSYQSKQAEVLKSDANLVEIDLLRGGEHVVAVPRYALERLEPYAYLVVVRRAAAPDRREVYPVRLAARLPRVAIPLRSPDRDVVADVQSLVNRAYERGAYGRRIDYRQSPSPPLRDADAAWAAECLAKADNAS